MPRRRRIRKGRTLLEVEQIDTPLGPLVRLSMDGRPLLVVSPNEARSLGYWLVQAANEAADQPSEWEEVNKQ